MDLVVASDASAVRIEQQGRIADPLRRVSPDHRGTAQDPERKVARGVAQKILDGSVAVGLGDGELVAILQADEREILGQAGDIGAELLRFAQQSAGGGEVVLDDMTRGHLDGGYLSHLLRCLRSRGGGVCTFDSFYDGIVPSSSDPIIPPRQPP